MMPVISKVIYSEVKVAQSCPTVFNPMEISSPEYRNGQPFPSLGDLPNPEIEPRSPTLQEDSLPAEPRRKPNLIHKFNAIYSKSQEDYYRYKQDYSVIYMESKGTRKAVEILEMKNKMRVISLLDFKTYYIAIVINMWNQWRFLFCSVTKSCLTLCNPIDCSTPGFPVLHYLLEFVQTQIH